MCPRAVETGRKATYCFTQQCQKSHNNCQIVLKNTRNKRRSHLIFVPLHRPVNVYLRYKIAG
jgi:hypothetical protein